MRRLPLGRTPRARWMWILGLEVILIVQLIRSALPFVEALT